MCEGILNKIDLKIVIKQMVVRISKKRFLWKIEESIESGF